YYGPPPQPYVVLGYLESTTAPSRRGGIIAFSARRAKELGADAIIVQGKGTEDRGSVGVMNTTGIFNTGGFTATSGGFSPRLLWGKATIVAIKWTPQPTIGPAPLQAPGSAQLPQPTR